MGSPARARKDAAVTDSPAKRAVGAGELVSQPHGGAIRRGNQPGGPGGPGRPSSEIKKLMRLALEERIPLVLEIVDANVPLREKCTKCGHVVVSEELPARAQPSVDDRLRGFEFLAKYGLEREDGISSAEIRRRLTRTIDVIQEILSPKDAHLLIAALRPVWS
jgi:hypothetical protein